ncbi:unnamed protein product [Periconia digitata]|uniref:Uncharacterized protein n=1 Tax=Periconia digitata TaxID=1303443 RepID=A0A9W4UBY8_9PLEO|nr:unnamed protein product [Periconia digitata]
MLLSSIKLALLASLAALGSAEDSKWCDFYKGADGGEPPFAPSMNVGYGGKDNKWGDYDCASRWQEGDPIIGVEAWTSRASVEAIQFFFASGETTRLYGKIPTPGGEHEGWHEKKIWDAGSSVEVRVFGNKNQLGRKGDDAFKSNAIGKLEIFQNNKAIFSIEAKHSPDMQPDYAHFNQGAGIIMGVRIRDKDWITNLDFQMLRSKVPKNGLKVIKIDPKTTIEEANAKQMGVDQKSLASVYYVNNNKPGGANVTWKFGNSKGLKTSQVETWARGHTFGFGLEMMVGGEAGIPLVTKGKVEITAKANYEYQTTKTTSTNHEDTDTLSWDISSGTTSNMLEPQKAMHCTSWCLAGRFDSDFDSVIEASMDDGGKFQYRMRGNIVTVSYTEAVASCREVDIKSVPNNAEMGDVENVKKRRSISYQA